MGFCDPVKVENHIIDIINAAPAGYGTAITDDRRRPHPTTGDNAITQARIESGMEILRAIASNPQHGWFGSLCTLVAVAHDAFIPAHDGEVGIPRIVPYSGATAREGIPADPDEIDSYRNDLPGAAFYSGALDGVQVAHDQVDANGYPSPLSCRYSIVNNRFKFTGYSAQIPLIQLTRTMADASVPDVYEATIVKLAIPKLVKEGDSLDAISERYRAAGMDDLILIMKGEMQVRPIPNIVIGQQQVI
jgi:hypothetical protein